MNPIEKYIPTSSQTVGPYFRIGLQYLLERAPSVQPGGNNIEIHGQVFDRDGAPVPDAVLEFWSAATDADQLAGQDQHGYPAGFRRAPTDQEGRFSAVIARPSPTKLGDGQMQAPHLLVLVFTRGLLRNLISRVYFADQNANDADPVLQGIPPERRGTLIAQPDGPAAYRWNVILQGDCETVFFAW